MTEDSKKVRLWDPTRVDLVVGVQTIKEFEPGTFIRLTPRRDDVREVFTIDGRLVTTRLNGRVRDCELFLAPGSSSNDYLSALRIAANLAPAGITYPFGLLDRNGTTLLGALSCRFRSAPDDEYATEPRGRVWRLTVTDALGHFGKISRV